MVAFKWVARGSEPFVDVHITSSRFYGRDHGTHGSYLPFIQIPCDFPNTQGFCICMEWRKLSVGSDAETSDCEGEKEIQVSGAVPTTRSALGFNRKRNAGERIFRDPPVWIVVKTLGKTWIRCVLCCRLAFTVLTCRFNCESVRISSTFFFPQNLNQSL